MENNSSHGSQGSRPAMRILVLAVSVAGGLALVALAVAWQWYESRSQISTLREEIARRVHDSESDAREARLLARQAQEALREAQAKLAQLELRITESQNRQTALEAVYEDVSRARDDWILAEIEQILVLVSQQLQLSGDARSAIAALEMTDMRLARSGKSRFPSLRRALARDIQRLKATPELDLSEIAGKLDRLMKSADALALFQDTRPAASKETVRDSTGSWWDRLVSESVGTFQQLVRVQKVEGAEPHILDSSQSFLLRETLKLRLLSARLALFARDESTYRNDLKVTSILLKRYFDTRSVAGAEVIDILEQLSSSPKHLSLPTVEESLAAVRSYRASRHAVVQ